MDNPENKNNKKINAILLISVSAFIILIAVVVIIFSLHQPKEQSNPEWYACTLDSDCTIINMGKCGCLTGGKINAINSNYKDQYIKPQSDEICKTTDQLDQSCLGVPVCKNQKCVIEIPDPTEPMVCKNNLDPFSCQVMQAIHKHDVSYCLQNKTTDPICIFYLTAATKNPDYCRSITNATVAERCLTIIPLSDRDFNGCKKFSKGLKEICISEMIQTILGSAQEECKRIGYPTPTACKEYLSLQCNELSQGQKMCQSFVDQQFQSSTQNKS